METFDGTILSSAAPAIARDFGVRANDIGIALTAYLLAVAVFIPVSGWAAGRVGSRRLFCIAIVVFMGASIVCAISGSLLVFTLARIVQGIGASMMVPVGRLIVLRSTDKSQLLRAIAFLTWPALLAPVVAPLVGGLITQFVGWPWIFYVNLPTGAILLFFAFRIIPRGGKRITIPLDVLGIIGFGATVVTLLLGLDSLSKADIRGLWLVGSAVVAGAFTIWWLRRARFPLLDLRVFSYPTFRVTNASGTWNRIAVSSAPYIFPLIFQVGFGWSPVEAGAIVMCVFLGNLAVKPVTGLIIRALGFMPVIVVSATGFSATYVTFAFLGPRSPVVGIIAVLVLSGALRSLGLSAYGTIQFADIPALRMSSANTMSWTVMQVGSGLGVAISAVAIHAILITHLEQNPALGGPLAPYRGALILMAVFSLLSVVGALRLPAGSGERLRVSGKPPSAGD